LILAGKIKRLRFDLEPLQMDLRNANSKSVNTAEGL
jgi:hypothetical protein